MVGAEPLLGMNFGTGTVEAAVAYVEYCNLDRGTRRSELRRAHGYDRPHNVRYWCLGNEMDGPWQIGQLQAREYGRKARDAAQQMRVIDPNLQLIACGSSGTFMPTYLTWDREVLEDALLVGGFVNTLLRNSDCVRVGCLAQLVNVIAPLVTNENGVLRQSTYYPYSWALRYARGRVLDLRVESDTYAIKGTGLQADFARDAEVPFLDVVATLDESGRPHRRADAQSRSRHRARHRPRMGRCRAHAGAHL
jgi:alpha-L-arabinofuranosidase